MANQRGLITFEVVALVVVVVIAAFIGMRVLHAKNEQITSGLPASFTKPASDVDNTADALAAEANNEANASNQTSNEANEISSTSNAASGIEGSYNENSF